MARHNSLGKWGEQVVADYLVAGGYDIVERNWRLNHLEIDIIATKGDEIAFVEVKSRSDDAIDPLSAITSSKVRLSNRTLFLFPKVPLLLSCLERDMGFWI